MHYKDPATLKAEKDERERLTQEYLDKGGVITKYNYREVSDVGFTNQQFNNSGPSSKGLINK